MNTDAYTGVLTPLELAYAQSVADKAMIAEIHAMLAAKLIAEARNGPSNAVQEHPAPQRGGVAPAPQRGGVALAPKAKIACQCADDAPEVAKKPSAIVVSDAASVPRGSKDERGRVEAATEMLAKVFGDPSDQMTHGEIIEGARNLGYKEGTARTYFTVWVKNGLIEKDEVWEDDSPKKPTWSLTMKGINACELP